MAERADGRAMRPANRIGSAATGNYHAHALTRGLLMLEPLGSQTDPLTLSETHERTGLPKSTPVRLLRAAAADLAADPDVVDALRQIRTQTCGAPPEFDGAGK